MAYNISVNIKNVKNPRALADLIAQIVESATGERATVNLYDKSEAIQKQNKLKQNTFKKLLK
jgi:hypothetical protein